MLGLMLFWPLISSSFLFASASSAAASALAMVVVVGKGGGKMYRGEDNWESPGEMSMKLKK